MHERRLEFDDADLARDLFGPQDANIALIRERTGVDLATRGSSVLVRASEAKQLKRVSNLLMSLYGLLKSGLALHPQDLEIMVTEARDPDSANFDRDFIESTALSLPKRTVLAKTASQRAYLGAIRAHDLTFGLGPAGTGKTYLAVAEAVRHFLERRVKRIVLARPAVEAGEKLGFLPGDLLEKVNPYLRPLYDALNDMLDGRRVSEMIETNVIEIAPLAFMRGRTLSDAFVILDEAQNTTREQMKMALTRLGPGSKMVVTGDVTQIDLPTKSSSGLVEAARILAGVQGVGFTRFIETDVIRHPLVARIVAAYEKDTLAAQAAQDKARPAS